MVEVQKMLGGIALVSTILYGVAILAKPFHGDSNGTSKIKQATRTEKTVDDKLRRAVVKSIQ